MKLIIDIDEELYKNVIDKTRNGYLGSDVWIAVAKGTPYEDRPTEKPGPKADPKSGDLISRSELEKAFEDYEAYSDIFPKTVYDIIDNAPTVIPDIEEFDKALHKWFEDIEEWEKKNGKIRPQGEWVSKHLWDNTHIWVCSECGNRNIHGITVEKACWRCGAEMRGDKHDD